MTTSTPSEASEAGPARRKRRGLVAFGVAVPLVLAGVALSVSPTRPAMLATDPVPVAQLAPSAAVSIKGQVAEIFGNKFVIQDDSGRALVELGRRGEGGHLVAGGESVTVQGRFENGFLHASALVHADGKVDVLGPAGGPPPGSLDWARSKVGLLPAPDVPAIIAALGSAGFSEVRVVGFGPRHVEVAAKDASGREHQLHVGPDGRIKRDRPIV